MPFVVALAALVGAAIGSFLTVVIPRLGTGETVVCGRSRCDNCKKNLSWYELLPVLSYIAQGGQCRSCGHRIPRMYPVIELITAASFAAIAWGVFSGALTLDVLLGNQIASGAVLFAGHALALFLYLAYFSATAIAVSAYDILDGVIPLKLIWPLAAVGIGAHILLALLYQNIWVAVAPGAVAILSFLLFWLIWYVSKGRGMGRGDADVAFAIALALSPEVSLVGLFLAFWLGTIFGILAIATRKLGWRSAIPFAPFLFGGTAVSLFFAQPLLAMFGFGIW